MEKQLYQSENGKLIRQHIEEVVNELDSVMDIKGDDPLSVAVQTEARKLAITTLNKLLQLTNYKEYEKERVELNEKHTKRDKDGNPVVKDKNYVIKDKAKFDEEVEKLKKKHKDAIEEREQQRKDVEDLANKEITLDLKTIPLSIVPDKVTVDQLNFLGFLSGRYNLHCALLHLCKLLQRILMS